MASTVFAWAVGLLSLLLPLLAIRWLWRENQAMNHDLVELFELRERMSTAAYQGSVTRSLYLLSAPRQS